MIMIFLIRLKAAENSIEELEYIKTESKVIKNQINQYREFCKELAAYIDSKFGQ